MKPFICSVLLLAAQVVAGSAFAGGARNEHGVPAASALRVKLLALERQRNNAILRRDIPALRVLMDRHYYHVESGGRLRRKTELLTALARGDMRFRTYETESAEIQVLNGGAAAVVAGVFRSVPAGAGAGAKPFRGRYVRVWVHQPDGWKNTFHQVTSMRPVRNGCDCD